MDSVQRKKMLNWVKVGKCTTLSESKYTFLETNNTRVWLPKRNSGPRSRELNGNYEKLLFPKTKTLNIRLFKHLTNWKTKISLMPNYTHRLWVQLSSHQIQKILITHGYGAVCLFTYNKEKMKRIYLLWLTTTTYQVH